MWINVTTLICGMVSMKIWKVVHLWLLHLWLQEAPMRLLPNSPPTGFCELLMLLELLGV